MMAFASEFHQRSVVLLVTYVEKLIEWKSVLPSHGEIGLDVV